ncbi:MAG: hypothetical protein AAF490_28105 [Chloroflexota bacterium]
MAKKGFLSRLFNRKKEVPELPDPESPVFSIPQVTVSKEIRPSVEMKEDAAVDAVYLRQQMLNFLTVEQIDLLAERLAVDSTHLEGGKGRRVMALLTAVSQQDNLPQLIKLCQELDPKVSWQE